ncbi:unnamed protein product, partial [Musa acuminata subsp. burmannicoides]
EDEDENPRGEPHRIHELSDLLPGVESETLTGERKRKGEFYYGSGDAWKEMGSRIGSSPTLRRRRRRDLTGDSSRRRTTARCAVERSSHAQNPTPRLGLGPIRS